MKFCLFPPSGSSRFVTVAVKWRHRGQNIASTVQWEVCIGFKFCHRYGTDGAASDVTFHILHAKTIYF